MKYLVPILLLLLATVAYAQRGQYRQNNGASVDKHNKLNVEPPLEMISDGTKNAIAIISTGITGADIATDPVIEVDGMTGDLDLGAGTVQGSVLSNVTTGTSMTPDMHGEMHYADPADETTLTTYNLPSAVVGMNACFYDNGNGAVGGGTGLVNINPNTGDRIVLDGTAGTAAISIESSGPDGEFVCLHALDAEYWIVLGKSGTWAVGS
jgi:hypothetical protein